MSDADTLQEFQKSYGEGWFGLKVGGEVFPAKIVSRSASKESLTLSYLANKGGATLSKDVPWVGGREALVRGYPDLGCIKVGPTVGYLKTRPTKQFKKGYVSANVELFVPNHTQIRKVFPKFASSPGNKELVWQVFRREYWTPAQAVRDLDAGEGVGYPLSPCFGLYASAECENLLILYRNKSVGVYKNNKFELFNGFSILKEQFQRETKVECAICPR